VAKDDEGKRGAASGRQIAVALAYTPEDRADVPKVVASGRGMTARRILDLAFTHGVKVREDADLAQVLAAVDVDSVIPLEAFFAVAQILAHVYKVNNRPLPHLTGSTDGRPSW
jgi:flagellar biosynthesis protein